MPRVLIPLATGFEELEAVTVIDLLRRAKIEVVIAGLHDGPIKASHGTVLLPDVKLDEVMHQDFDMLVLPGGLPGADHLDKDARIHNLIKRLAQADKYLTAICAAPKVLARSGLLDGRAATCYPGFLDKYPRIDVLPAPVVTDGKFITSRGPGTAMDFALVLIETLTNRVTRDIVEEQLKRDTD
ncbi:4-methyl-5(B-hydroxyethyl)-thiazole monophosphate biosynthesis protein [Achromatium sp. WMS2]|nr:4-methyl-5(B-hydroxyethyl)-thiazole monophosphate biosynthesis protein [Achromatium sp. WMS2]